MPDGWNFLATVFFSSVRPEMPLRALLFFVPLIIFIFYALPSTCQDRDSEALRHQLTFTCDNNFLLFDGDDGYYTDGVFLRYDRISRKETPASVKRIFSYEIGQMMYTAYSRKILPASQSGIPGGISQIDRPIAGYLFGKATRSSFYHDRRMLALGVSIGTIGENSLSKEAQEFWHRMIGVKDYWNWVWDYQVKNEVGINIHGTFANSLINRKNSFFQITPVTQATLGTTFTNLSQAVLLQFGRLRPMSSSSYWHSRLQLTGSSTNSPMELFLYYKPEVKYQLYNATIQGGLFRSDKGPILSEIKPFVFSHEVGIRFSIPRYCFAYYVTFQSKEALGQFYNQSYASLALAYRFR